MHDGFGGPDDVVFCSQETDGPLSRSQLWRIVRKATCDAEEDVSPRWFRHTHVSHTLDRDPPAYFAQQTLSHTIREGVCDKKFHNIIGPHRKILSGPLGQFQEQIRYRKVCKNAGVKADAEIGFHHESFLVTGVGCVVEPRFVHFVGELA
jgi:hypothetical protein